jgi:hypothetical protein
MSKTDAHTGSDANNSLLHLFSKNASFWSPYRSFAEALMETQLDASAYLEANRKLMDEIRDIVRREQDLSLEISSRMLKRTTESGGLALHDASQVNAMFDRAIEGVRELSEAWKNAQMRSLEVMREHAFNGRKLRTARKPAPE